MCMSLPLDVLSQKKKEFFFSKKICSNTAMSFKERQYRAVSHKA
jgi:hypothetical protein